MFKPTNPSLIITTWFSLDHKLHKVAPQTASRYWSILMTLCAALLMRLLQVSELWRAELAALWITKHLQAPLWAFIDPVAMSCTELICQQICKTYAFCFAHICRSGPSWIHRADTCSPGGEYFKELRKDEKSDRSAKLCAHRDEAEIDRLQELSEMLRQRFPCETVLLWMDTVRMHWNAAMRANRVKMSALLMHHELAVGFSKKGPEAGSMYIMHNVTRQCVCTALLHEDRRGD